MTRLRRSALLAFLSHLLAGVAMLLVLRNGLETNPDFQGRLAFIVDHESLWIAGWLTWTAAAIAIIFFYATFASAHQTGQLAVVLAGAGIAADICGQAIEIGVLPAIAERIIYMNTGTGLFIALHRTSVMMSGYVANGLYSIAALILAVVARRAHPLWVSIAGMAVGCVGVLLSVAALADSVAGMFWTNVLLVPSILLWLAGVALTSRSKPPSF